MKKWESGLALMMAVTLFASGGTSAFADVNSKATAAPTSVATAPKEVRTSLNALATVSKINLESGQMTVKIEDQVIVLNTGVETLFINAKSGIPSSLKDIKEGDQVYVTYSAAMTRSLPPQSSAIAVVTGIEKDQTIPRFMTIKEIVSSTKDQVRFLNTDGDMIVTLVKENPISPFKTKQIVTIGDLNPGGQVFVWYDIVLESYPGQTTAKKTVVVNVGEDTVVNVTPSKMTIDGKAIDLGKLKIVEKNGKWMVPFKAVTKALGFKLSWNTKTMAASIDNGIVKTEVTVGQDVYYKASSKAIGLTAPMGYGASPEIIGGALYVPVDLFKLLYSNDNAVKVVGDTIQIQTNQK